MYSILIISTTLSCQKNGKLVELMMFWAADAMAGGILDKYLKKKKLDPLEAYVPAVILTEMQIKDLGKFLEVDKPKFGDCRSLLRSGPASSLRVNIRAVAQYASESADNNSAFNSVDECLRALEDLDSMLLNASRNDSGASIQSMKAKIDVATNALDSLLKTVPSDVLEKGKAIADAYRDPVDDTPPENDIPDPELKQLESIL
ncbi:OLC1v1031973C4 [Oldenlandia corymbosa var. corymbosa]|uniref:OLC1v1031973C4 n=1 Tax=Oldenlandia corymbosa var. corymbosa TaxID=529605 RepID=A0AAV1CLG9_OLDCO|nr:OLC1v1031973C4 [Oldenlandia corymbosa var. corymbosa]